MKCKKHNEELLEGCARCVDEVIDATNLEFLEWLNEHSKRDSDQNLVVDGYEFDKKVEELMK